MCLRLKHETDEREISDIFNGYFSQVARDIGFKYNIPDDFQTDDGFVGIIDKHSNHSSVYQVQRKYTNAASF